MRKLWLIILIIGTCSCDEFFHEEVTSVGKIDSYEELVSAVGGVYGKLAEATNAELGVGFNNPNIKGDDLGNNLPVYQDWTYDCSVDNQVSGEYFALIPMNWKYLYATIISANNIIKQYEISQLTDPPTKEILGEVYIIRAYSYFRLARIYGQIPLIDDIEIDYSEPKASYVEIFSFIESDLTKAISLLPSNNAEARVPGITPHRGVAKAILAEVYLNWAGYPIADQSKYELSANLAGQVIDSAEYFGFGLLDDFANVWDDAHLINKESVFSLYFAEPLGSVQFNQINSMYFGRFFFQQNLDSTAYAYYIEYMTFWFPPVENMFFDNFPDNYRKEITFFTNHYIPDLEIWHYSNSVECIRIAYRKFFYDLKFIESSQLFGFEGVLYFLGSPRIYLYRYAHTLLTFAEASARSGNLDSKSYDCVNQVRRRANNLDITANSEADLLPGLSEEAFVDSVLWERAWELAGEPEGRWFDLLRTGLVNQLEEFRYDFEGGVPFYPITEEDYYSPIPMEDQLLNPSLMK